MNRAILHSSRVYGSRTGQILGKRRISDFSVVTSIQTGMQSMQAATGLPWFLTFAVASSVVRLSLFPLVRQRFIIGQNLQQSLPELNALYKMFIRRLQMVPATRLEERTKIMSIFFKGVKSSLALHRVNTMGMFTYPVATLACFITFFYSLRSMVTAEHRALKEEPKSAPLFGLSSGGALWFRDLTQADSTRLLPLISCACTYAALEVGFKASDGLVASKRLTLPRTIKGFFQAAFIFGFPLISTMPAGVFCYWIPGSFVSMAQTVAMRSPVFLRLIGLKP